MRGKPRPSAIEVRLRTAGKWKIEQSGSWRHGLSMAKLSQRKAEAASQSFFARTGRLNCYSEILFSEQVSKQRFGVLQTQAIAL
jgi:hypothetical protein